MLKSQMDARTLLHQPSAFVPIAMSLIALVLVFSVVLHDVVVSGAVVHEADEGAAAHLWQLLMAGQGLAVAVFVIQWLPRAPRQTLYILALQIGTALASMATVLFLHL